MSFRGFQLAFTDDMARLSKFFQAARIAVLLIDVDGHCVSANDAWVDLTGVSPKDSLGHGWKRYLPEAVTAQLVPTNHDVLISVDVSRHAFFRSQLNVQILSAGNSTAGAPQFFLLFNVAQVTWSSAGLLSRATEAGGSELEMAKADALAVAPILAPLSAPGGSTTIAQTAAPVGALHGLSILVVEDSPVSQTIACKLLEKAGAVVSTASDGNEAVEVTKHKKFDVILMDCEMPDMDGFEATRVIRSTNNRNSGVPIIALTGNASAQNEKKCFHSGMNAHVPKPFDPEFLERTILRYAQPVGQLKSAF